MSNKQTVEVILLTSSKEQLRASLSAVIANREIIANQSNHVCKQQIYQYKDLIIFLLFSIRLRQMGISWRRTIAFHGWGSLLKYSIH